MDDRVPSPTPGLPRANVLTSSLPIVVATFYQFVSLPDCVSLRDELEQLCLQQQLRGTILLATEGINSTIAGTRASVETLLARLRSDPRLTALDVKLSFVDWMPFQRLKVRLRSEIITLGQPTANPHRYTGIYVDPSEWNALISDSSVTVLDVRNQYEVECGTFNRAINPEINSFGEFPGFVHHNLDPQVHRKIAMFCTGGIRCEKASAYMLSQGFEQVYQLKGGILKYLEMIPADESQWHGDCFVFDDRVTLNHCLQPSHHP